MKVLITGATGLLGSTVLFHAPKKYSLYGTYHDNTLVPKATAKYVYIDITKPSSVHEAIKRVKPDVIIHTAALATPDYCDKHRDEAFDVNVNGTKHLIEASAKLKVKPHFIYITTNGVYDGDHAPYDEAAVPKPIDWYGETKLQAEQLVQHSQLPYSIVRLNTMYGWNNPHERQNPVTWLIKTLGENKTPVNMVKDMHNSFLYVVTAAQAIWAAIEIGAKNESYNIGGKDCENRYEFSQKIAQQFKLPLDMMYPVDLSFFQNFVPRPKNTCFLTTKMKKVLKVTPITSKAALSHMAQYVIDESSWRRLR